MIKPNLLLDSSLCQSLLLFRAVLVSFSIKGGITAPCHLCFTSLFLLPYLAVLNEYDLMCSLCRLPPHQVSGYIFQNKTLNLNSMLKDVLIPIRSIIGQVSCDYTEKSQGKPRVESEVDNFLKEGHGRLVQWTLLECSFIKLWVPMPFR